VVAGVTTLMDNTQVSPAVVPTVTKPDDVVNADLAAIAYGQPADTTAYDAAYGQVVLSLLGQHGCIAPILRAAMSCSTMSHTTGRAQSSVTTLARLTAFTTANHRCTGISERIRAAASHTACRPPRSPQRRSQQRLDTSQRRPALSAQQREQIATTSDVQSVKEDWRGVPELKPDIPGS